MKSGGLLEALTRAGNKHERTLQRDVMIVLRSWIGVMCDSVAAGQTIKQAIKAAMNGLQADLEQAKGRVLYDAAAGGYDAGLVALGDVATAKSLGSPNRWVRAKRDEPAADQVAIETDPTGFTSRALRADVAEWIVETSRIETDTTAALIESQFRELMESGKYTGRALAKQLETLQVAQTKQRADLIAETAATWATNRGAMIAWYEAGVSHKEWLTTRDDLSCPYCRWMNGKRAPVDEYYGIKGDSIETKYSDGTPTTFNLGIDVAHPPLHPRCRCSMLPLRNTNAPELDPLPEVDRDTKRGIDKQRREQQKKRQEAKPERERREQQKTPQWIEESKTYNGKTVSRRIMENPDVSSVEQAESLIVDKPQEVTYIFDSNGKCRRAIDCGDNNAVYLTREDADLMRGGVVTHNHPGNPEDFGGDGLSPPDILTALRSGCREMRAVSRNGVSILRIPEEFTYTPEIKDHLEQHLRQAREVQDGFVRAGKKTKLQAGYKAQHNAVKRLAKQYGLEYTVP